MFYMLIFAAGYYLGSGGKIAFKPTVTQGADGSLVVGPPESAGQNPSTVGYQTNTARYTMPASLGYPAGTTYDTGGNVYDPRGQLVGTGAAGLPGIAQQAAQVFQGW